MLGSGLVQFRAKLYFFFDIILLKMGSAPVDYNLNILHGNRLKVKVFFLSRPLIGRNLLAG